MRTQRANLRFCGKELLLIQEVVQTCTEVSTELVFTICGLLQWERANGGSKARKDRSLLGRQRHAALTTRISPPIKNTTRRLTEGG